MKVAVLGGGVIGVASAYYLAARGYEVVLLDRQPGPALETSFANAAEVSPGLAAPWAAPGVPLAALSWLFAEHPPLIVQPFADLAMLPWLGAMLLNCSRGRFEINRDRMARLADFSRDCLIELRTKSGIRYDERSRGTLEIFRSAKQMDAAIKALTALRSKASPFEVLSPAECVEIEPGLAYASGPFSGGVRFPNDETGDCHMFANALADKAAELGVDLQYGRRVESLRIGRDGIAAAVTDEGEVRADVFVVAMGSFSPMLLRPLGLRLPVYPVKGYSVTGFIEDEARAPVSTVLDERNKVVVTRLGDRIRIAGIAELSGHNLSLPKSRLETLEHCFNGLFPGAGRPDRATYWSGRRPMTPDGTPVIGATPIPNLYLNTGHGTFGWTMACGSAQVLSDIVSGSATAIETHHLGLSRF